MLVKLLEPLNVKEEVIESYAKTIREMGHEFEYFPTKTTDANELTSRSEGADVIMIANNPYPTQAIDQNGNLKLINVAFTGFDHVGLAAAKRHDEILMCNAAGYANQAVAELVIGLTLDVYRKITEGDHDIRLANFPGPFQGREISGKTVGIVGTGKIGMMTARLFHAFGAKVIGYDHGQNPEAKEIGMEYRTLEELLQEADIVSLHLPLNDSTRGIIGAKEFALMKETAVLINTARGPVVDNAALAKALENKEISGAGIDVFDGEPPLPSDYPLLGAPNAVLTPHIAFLTDESMVLRAKIAFENTINFLKGEPTNIVNKK